MNLVIQGPSGLDFEALKWSSTPPAQMTEKNAIKFTFDGVPQCGGEAELLPIYKEEALQYLMMIEHRKRYPKVLTGVANGDQDRDHARHPVAVTSEVPYQLLELLEDFLAKPTLVESSRHIMKFFYNLRRRRGETMTAWIARHAKALWEANQATREVQKETLSKNSVCTMGGGKRGPHKVGGMGTTKKAFISVGKRLLAQLRVRTFFFIGASFIPDFLCRIPSRAVGRTGDTGAGQPPGVYPRGVQHQHCGSGSSRATVG